MLAVCFRWNRTSIDVTMRSGRCAMLTKRLDLIIAISLGSTYIYLSRANDRCAMGTGNYTAFDMFSTASTYSSLIRGHGRCAMMTTGRKTHATLSAVCMAVFFAEDTRSLRSGDR